MKTQVQAAINGLSLQDVNGAIALVTLLLTGDTVKPEARPGVEEKLAALVERRRRLIVTGRSIARGNAALKGVK